MVNERRLDASYRRLLKNLSDYDNVTVLRADYPAETLIKKTEASVSMPWTSTAILADYLNKPSCYYDSTETVLHDDRAAHGVPVFIGKKELHQYLLTVFEERG